ncbi:Puromycin-sensitive aminopeptidase [Chlorella vulgaris]
MEASREPSGELPQSSPVHLLYQREITLDVPPDQLDEAVAAIVDMLPLPAAPAEQAFVAERQASAEATAPSSPGSWHVVRETVWHPPLPGDARHSGTSSSLCSSWHSAESGTQQTTGSSTASTAGSQPVSPAGLADEEKQPAVPPPPRPRPSHAAGAPSQQGRVLATGMQVRPRWGEESPPASAPPPDTPRSPPGRQHEAVVPASQHNVPASPATPVAIAPAPSRQPAGQPAAPQAPARSPSPALVAIPAGAAPHPETPADASLSAAGSWPGAVPPWRGHGPGEQAPGQAGTVPQRRSRLAEVSSSPAKGRTGGAQEATAGRTAAAETARTEVPPQAEAGEGEETSSGAQEVATGENLPESSSADEPQLTEIRGPWPPPPPLAAAAPRHIHTLREARPGSTSPGHEHLHSAFASAAAGSEQERPPPGWRQLDDGSWVSWAEVEWYQGEAGSRAAGTGLAASAEGVRDLIHCPLVTAASHSPPLSPVSSQLLSLRQPTRGMRRGPQRAASLGLASDRQQSLLSPERQPSPQRRAAPVPAAEIEEVAGVLSQAVPGPCWAQQPGQEQGQAQQHQDQPLQRPRLTEAGARPPLAPRRLLPVLLTSPDQMGLSPAGVEEDAALSPFPDAPSTSAAATGGPAAFSTLGGLPTELLDKREHRRQLNREDLSPREAYSGGNDLRTPLLPVAGEGAEGDFPPSGGTSVWACTALLATPLLGAGTLAAPRAFGLLGLVAGGVSVLVAAAAALAAQLVLIAACRRQLGALRGVRYADVARAALGPAGALLADLSIAVACFGLMTASFGVLGDALVGGEGSRGLLGEWGGDRATVLAVVSLVVLAPMVCLRNASSLVGSSAMAITAGTMAGAALLALTVLASSQHALQPMRAWPDWSELAAGGRSGWFARAGELLAVIPVLLVASLSHCALFDVVQLLPPRAANRAGRAAAMSLLCGTALLALLAVCCYALFGSDVQPDVLLDITPEALVSLAGDPAGRAAYLLLRLAFVVCLAAGLPLLPLLAGVGHYLVTLLSLAAALWASLALQSGDALWRLLSWLGCTTGSLLALVLPGLVAACNGGVALRVVGVTLLALGCARRVHLSEEVCGTVRNTCMEGERANGGPLAASASAAEEGWASFQLDRPSPGIGLQPLNLEPSSAPVPAGIARTGSGAPPPATGRATSSKWCIVICCFVSAAAIALMVGLSVGLAGGDDSGGSNGSSEATAAADTTVTVYGASLPSQCKDMATIPYWEVVNISHYDLSLELTDEMFSFRGLPVPPLTFNASATVLFSVQQQAASCVVLNARNLTFQSIALERQLSDGSFGTATQLCSEAECAAGGQIVSLPFERRASADATRALSSGDVDLLSISLGTVVLQPGSTARLVLQYNGLLGSWPGNSTGLYSSAPFLAADKSELEFMVVTQGEPTGTRQMLPCYDQPARKATFGVEVKVPALTPSGAPMKALSNMPLKDCTDFDLNTTDGQPAMLVEFQVTPLMSPYLLAVAAGGMVQYTGAEAAVPDNSSSTGGCSAGGGSAAMFGGADGLPALRFWAAPGLEGQLAAAAEVGPKAFSFYRSYLGVDLPEQLTKMDLLAVPGKSGAMENWGLLMMDEARFLLDPLGGEGQQGYKQLGLVICHEVAHQWVGNLATKQDFAMLSVDEGLAAFLEYKCLDQVLEGYEGEGQIHFYRTSPPQLQAPGKHDGPGFLALQLAADPTQPPMVPQNDMDIGTGSFMQYSKPAALLRAHELYLRAAGTDLMPSILQDMLLQAQYSAWNWSMYFAASNRTLAARGGAVTKSIESRAGSFMTAQSYEEVMAMIDGPVPTMATWFYSPVYPIARIDTSSADGGTSNVVLNSHPDVADSGNATQVNAYNYNQTVFAIGGTSQPFCAFPITAEIAQMVEAEDVANELIPLCSKEPGGRYFPLTMSLDNLTSCSTDGTHVDGWAGRFDELVATQPPTWVDNQEGARLMRSVYDQAHLDSLVAVVGSMTAVETSCCTTTSDLLEAAALLTDVAALAQTGSHQAAAAAVTAVTALQALEGALKDTGAVTSGRWQYLVARTGLEALFQFNRYTDVVREDRPECSDHVIEYLQQLMQGTATALSTDWLQAGSPTNDTLKQLVGPRMLWMLSLAGEEAIQQKMCMQFIETPLWQRVLDVFSGGEGELDDTQIAPGSMGSDALALSPDLLPGLYMAGPMLAGICNDTLLGGAAGVPANLTMADLAVPLVKAMQRCYLTDPSGAEAVRCLYALPTVAVLLDSPRWRWQQPDSTFVSTLWDKAADNGTLVWLLQTSTPAASKVCAEFVTEPVRLSRCARRAVDLQTELPALINLVLRTSSASYAAALDFLTGKQAVQRSVPEWHPGFCGLLTVMDSPTTAAGHDLLKELLTTGPAKDCPPAAKLRAASLAQQQMDVFGEQAGDMCDYVAQRLEAWDVANSPP